MRSQGPDALVELQTDRQVDRIRACKISGTENPIDGRMLRSYKRGEQQKCQKLAAFLPTSAAGNGFGRREGMFEWIAL